MSCWMSFLLSMLTSMHIVKNFFMELLSLFTTKPYWTVLRQTFSTWVDLVFEVESEEISSIYWQQRPYIQDCVAVPCYHWSSWRCSGYFCRYDHHMTGQTTSNVSQKSWEIVKIHPQCCLKKQADGSEDSDPRHCHCWYKQCLIRWDF